MVAVLAEDLHPAIATITYVQASLGVHRQSMRVAELTILCARLAPFHNECAVTGEFHNTIVAGSSMTVHDENIPIRCDQHIGWLPESIFPISGYPWLAERHK